MGVSGEEVVIVCGEGGEKRNENLFTESFEVFVLGITWRQ